MIETDKLKKMAIEWGQADDKRDQGLDAHPDDISRQDNISYGNFGQDSLLDIYRPKKLRNKILPTIISVHGGGYFYGDKERYQYYCLALARYGFVVINFNYRLAPEYPYPAAIDDVAGLIDWLDQNADEYLLDRKNFFVVGDSAGGQLAEQYLTIYSSRNYRDLFSFKKPHFHISAAALNSGVYFLDEDKTITGPLKAYFDKHAVNDLGEQLKVENFITKEFPPVYVATAVDDFLKEKGVSLDRFLEQKNIEHQFKIYGDEQHRRGHVFHLDQHDKLAKECNDAEIEFFLKHIDK
ncbi:alpha/beta hydrolase [Oenococcus alcoholitolerans]|uniref:BD-FAE-like domain-containing protein n=1 Tax=Oenococcus alcoholitolerans TaxID=931074 RepID=A0ABR4XSK2_9LACO|nr:hypothetical protein Q757_01760 [Oenococcus alcoholitolerans]